VVDGVSEKKIVSLGDGDNVDVHEGRMLTVGVAGVVMGEGVKVSGGDMVGDGVGEMENNKVGVAEIYGLSDGSVVFVS